MKEQDMETPPLKTQPFSKLKLKRKFYDMYKLEGVGGWGFVYGKTFVVNFDTCKTLCY